MKILICTLAYSFTKALLDCSRLKKNNLSYCKKLSVGVNNFSTEVYISTGFFLLSLTEKKKTKKQ